MGFASYYAAYGGSPPSPSGAHHASIAPYGPFRAGDGQFVFLAIQNAREWARFCSDVLDRPELADDTRFATNTARVQHRASLHEAVGTLSRAQLRQIAETKMPDLNANDVDAAMHIVAGTARSMGVEVGA